MVLNNINKNDSILLEVFASVFTVSSNFTDNPRTFKSDLFLFCFNTRVTNSSLLLCY